MKKIMCDPYRRQGTVFGLSFAVLTLGLMPHLTQGLKCYECLSLSCESGAICESIKDVMEKIFVPKSHFIHFDPRDHCPESENPYGNSTEWAYLSRECHRSDSFCLVAPIKVETNFDGTKSAEELVDSTMSSVGYLRGCASRRKLLEKEDTIKVVVRVTDDTANAAGTGSNDNSPTSTNQAGGSNQPDTTKGAKNATRDNHVSHDNHRHQQSLQNSGMNDVLFHPSSGKSGLNNNTYGDGYIITKIYSHVFYIDQGRSNATRCYDDNCNNRIKPKRSGAISVNSNGITTLVYASIAANYILRNFFPTLLV